MADRFEDLRTFVAVVDAGGFAAAGDRMGVVKSAVSRRVRDLEDRLGARLFDRTTRSVRLTEAGVGFYDRSVALLSGLAEAEAEASGAGGELRGRIRLAAPASFTSHCIAPVIGGFIESHPSVEMSVETGDRLVDPGRDGFDLAIGDGRPPYGWTAERDVAVVRRVWVASPALVNRVGVPRSTEDLSRFPVILHFDGGEARDRTFTAGELQDARNRIAFDDGDAVREASVAGLGLALLPAFLVHAAVARGDLRVVLEEPREPSVMRAFGPVNGLTARARALVDYLADRFQGTPFWEERLSGG